MSKQRVFRFKEFSIDHSRSSMKVGTDGVLLGAWARIGNARQILDIGTGSGVIALMMAQRSSPEARIDAVDIHESDASQALENVRHSPWHSKVSVHCADIRSFAPDYVYDLIVTNPPFFLKSLRPPDEKRNTARHADDALSFEALIAVAGRHLSKDGALNLILPPVEAAAFLDASRGAGFFLSRKCLFRSRATKPVERWLMELRLQKCAVEEADLVLYKGVGEIWSDEYRNLTSAFYLNT